MSLRDVERAMIVFKYFYENMDNFADLIDEKQQEEERKVTANKPYEREETEQEERRDEVMEKEEEGEGNVQGEMVSYVFPLNLVDLITYC